MKKSILILLLSVLFYGIQGAPLQENTKDTVSDIQTRIHNALTDCFRRQAAAPLDAIYKELQKNAEKNSLLVYWMAYTRFYEGIYYIKMQAADSCKKQIEKAEELLKNQKHKNSEDYALLAYIQSFSLQFQQGMAAAQASAEVKANGEKAIQMNPENLRGWYVLGSHDFYTPAAFGGGQKAEEYLRKALETKDDGRYNPWLPSWGKEEAYDMIIRMYLQKKDTEKARKYYESALRLFPESYFINQYKEKFSHR